MKRRNMLLMVMLLMAAGCVAVSPSPLVVTPIEPTPAPIVDAGPQEHDWPELGDTITVNPVLLVFYADWCTPCKRNMPTIERFAREAKIDVIMVNVDTSPGMVEEFEVTRVPTYIVIDETFGELIRTSKIRELSVFHKELP